jgi:hypothetical protein
VRRAKIYNWKEIMTEDHIQCIDGPGISHGPHAVDPDRDHLRRVYLGEDVGFTGKSRTRLETIAK